MMLFGAPWNAPVAQITIRNPEWANKTQLVGQVREGTLMSGNSVIYRNTPNEFEFEMQITEIDRAKVEEYIDFFSSYSHQLMRFIDHEGTSWKARLLEDPSFTQDNYRTSSMRLHILAEAIS